MAIQEVTSTGWFGRIGESIKGILFGGLLVIGALVLLVLNERNAIRDIRANNEIAHEVVSIESTAVNPANEGKLVHLNGPAKTDDILSNKEFGIEEAAVRLKWDAKIYQWVETKHTKTRKKLGGGEEKVTTYDYKKEWKDEPVDSSKFKEAGHNNGGKRKFKSGSVQASHVTLGAFQLPPELIAQMKAYQPYPITELPEGLAAGCKVADGIFHTGDDLKDPQIGDEKVEFKIIRPGDVSVMAVQSNDSFTAYQARNGKTKFLLYDGLLTAGQVVQQEESKAKLLRWILRGVGFLLMFAGMALVLRPLSILADLIPLFGSLVGGVTGVVSFLAAGGVTLAVIAISWIAFRPLLGVPLLVLGIACFVGVAMKLVRGRPAGVR